MKEWLKLTDDQVPSWCGRHRPKGGRGLAMDAAEELMMVYG
jgi:hypothetical protein